MRYVMCTSARSRARIIRAFVDTLQQYAALRVRFYKIANQPDFPLEHLTTLRLFILSIHHPAGCGRFQQYKSVERKY